ncbi:hypothetical protein P7M43_27185 [Vibrio parahaemolyticus]|nr:hypothetical protein [Vibrio parahaemolyticus]
MTETKTEIKTIDVSLLNRKLSPSEMKNVAKLVKKARQQARKSQRDVPKDSPFTVVA